MNCSLNFDDVGFRIYRHTHVTIRSRAIRASCTCLWRSHQNCEGERDGGWLSLILIDSVIGFEIWLYFIWTVRRSWHFESYSQPSGRLLTIQCNIFHMEHMDGDPDGPCRVWTHEACKVSWPLKTSALSPWSIAVGCLGKPNQQIRSCHESESPE